METYCRYIVTRLPSGNATVNVGFAAATANGNPPEEHDRVEHVGEFPELRQALDYACEGVESRGIRPGTMVPVNGDRGVFHGPWVTPTGDSMKDVIRRVRFTPYRRACGPSFALTVWDTGRTISGGKDCLGYRLNQIEGRRRVTLFEGEDFGCSPMHAIDSDDAVASLMGFLTLRPGDTDAEYFENYTPAQLDYCAQHAEALGFEVHCRFGEG